MSLDLNTTFKLLIGYVCFMSASILLWLFVLKVLRPWSLRDADRMADISEEIKRYNDLVAANGKYKSLQDLDDAVEEYRSAKMVELGISKRR